MRRAGGRATIGGWLLCAALLVSGCDGSGGSGASASDTRSPTAPVAGAARAHEREPMSDDAVAAARARVPGVIVALDSVRSRGASTPAEVVETLEAEGFADVRTREVGSRLLFGAAAPEGGCLYGEIRERSVQVEVDGPLSTGDCSPTP